MLLDKGDVIDLRDRAFHLNYLPGYSFGPIAMFEKTTGILFSGNVVYNCSLIDDLYHSDAEVLSKSHTRLCELDATTVHPGHFQSFERGDRAR